MIADFIYLAIFPKANIKSKQMMSKTILIFFTEKLHPKSLFYLGTGPNFEQSLLHKLLGCLENFFKLKCKMKKITPKNFLYFLKNNSLKTDHTPEWSPF